MEHQKPANSRGLSPWDQGQRAGIAAEVKPQGGSRFSKAKSPPGLLSYVGSGRRPYAMAKQQQRPPLRPAFNPPRSRIVCRQPRRIRSLNQSSTAPHPWLLDAKVISALTRIIPQAVVMIIYSAC